MNRSDSKSSPDAAIDVGGDLWKGSLFPLLLMIAFAAILTLEIRRIQYDYNQAQNIETINREAQNILGLMIDMETGIRGYIITGVRTFLDPYKQATPLVKPSFEKLERLVAYNPPEQKIIRKTESLEESWLARTDEEISESARGKIPATALMLEKKQLMDQIRTLMGEFVKARLRERDRWTAQAHRTEIFTLASAVMLSLFAGGLFGLVSRHELRVLSARYLEQSNHLVEARGQAEAANRAKDNFLAMVSHELRSPISSILNWTEVIRKSKQEPQVVDRGLDAIERSGRAQVQLVNDLMDVGRIVTGKLQINPRQIEIARVVSAAIDTVKGGAEAKQLQLVTRLDPASGSVWADSDRIQQIVWNLLSNAIKYTPAGGRIEVSLRGQTDAAVELAVTDSGEGIEPDFLPFVFNRFWQESPTNQNGNKGLGLGLAIVRHLTELHGGSVSAYSAGKGAGARFEVILPRAAISTAPVSDALN